MRSKTGGSPSEIAFVNLDSQTRRLYSVSPDGRRRLVATLEPSTSHRQRTADGEVWIVTNGQDACLHAVTARVSPLVFEILSEEVSAPVPQPGAPALPEPPTPRGAPEPPMPTPLPVAPPAALPPTELYQLSGTYGIQHHNERLINNTRDGRPTAARAKLSWGSAQWMFEDVPGTSFVRIVNRGKNSVLYLSNNGIRTRDLPPDDPRTHWEIEPVPGTDYFRLLSAGSPEKALAVMRRRPQVIVTGEIRPDDPQGHWRLVRPDGGRQALPVRPLPVMPQIQEIECVGGTVSRGRCFCPQGSFRVREGDGLFVCVRRVREEPDGCIGGNWTDDTCDCPADMVFDGRRCVVPADTPRRCARLGLFFDGQECVSFCPAGMIGRRGFCIPLIQIPTCPPGFGLSARGRCIQLGFVPCRPGTVRQRGRCVPLAAPPCPRGMVRDARGQCSPIGAPPCPNGFFRNAAGRCVTVGRPCPPGQTRQGNRCIPIVAPCPPGQTRQGNRCVAAPCPPGTIRRGPACVPAPCPPGQTRQGEIG
ncbi:MAG: hypothetical protein AB7U66_17275, partial [Hyphomicrobiaceae bacterium]